MKRVLILALLLPAAACMSLSAQGIKGKLKKLINSNATTAAADTLLLPAPYVMRDGAVTLSDTPISGTGPDEALFVHALLRIIDLGEKGKRNIARLDVQDRTFGTALEISMDEADGKASKYVCRLTCAAADGVLSICADSIHYVSQTFLGEEKSTPFERLNLQKPKTQSLMQDFASWFDGLVQELRRDYDPSTAPIAHWDEIAEGRAVPGMTETECTLACGRPLHVRDSGARTRWMMAGNVTIIFEQGRVQRIVR